MVKKLPKEVRFFFCVCCAALGGLILGYVLGLEMTKTLCMETVQLAVDTGKILILP